jgi:hypothetical protein
LVRHAFIFQSLHLLNEQCSFLASQWEEEMKSILNLPWLQSKWDGFRVEDLRVGLRTKLQGRVQGLKLPWVLSGLIDGVMAFSFPPMFHVLPLEWG